MRGFITAGTLAIVLATTGLAAQAGGADGSNWIANSMRQVQAGDYSAQYDQNGEVRFPGR